ncbi:AraC family transcriptional regulator [Hydrogenophaga pseudoflava]|uniref:Urease operon transcriptional activator n=1 Tax=Hydrogenophaga pseudoflava TaxID=47421 RepID=A0A4P6X6Q2_HYDPS|nr:AraC family transcriptional regulator [Hydrogenophaga pseudoflava]QBM30198.1 Urease operon transcriptional activator [Hydrogenophaga pseudoflava]
MPAPRPNAHARSTVVAATPMAFVQAIARAYALRQLAPDAALAAAQIAPADLDRPGARITALQMEWLSAAAMQELDDEGLGWFARPLPWGSYGMLARASLSAPTLGVALKRWCRHHGLLTRDITLAVQTEGDEARIVLGEHRPPGGDGSLREFCFVSVLRNIHGLACWFVDSRIPLLGASFPYSAPPHAETYRVLFDGPTRFDAEDTSIRFDARYLALPIKRDEAAMNQMLQRALPIQVRPYRRDRLLVQRVRQVLLNQPQDAHNADDLAALLHTSARTLHRQLKEEGATLQALKDEVRRERAMALLQRTNRPIKQIAAATGFLNEKSFIRAFKTWTGMAPGEWRAMR